MLRMMRIEILKVNINNSRFMSTPSCSVMLAFLSMLRPLRRSKLPGKCG